MQIPTLEAYAEMQAAFDHFNETLFNNDLVSPLFTFQRERRTYGYCSRQRFVSRNCGGFVDEIAMNPAYFAVRSTEETLSTLVHEMVHQWQYAYGKPGRRGYHNKQWAEKMELIGLMPSNTGAPGGKKTGEQMSHYIINGGLFDLSCQTLLTSDFILSWLDRYPAERPRLPPSLQAFSEDLEPDSKKSDLDDIPEIPGVILPTGEPINRSNRHKYYCGECGGQAWGKPGMILLCAGRNQEGIESSVHSAKTMVVVGA